MRLPIAGSARTDEALRHALGETVLAGLADPEVVEVLVNPDGRIIFDRLGSGRSDRGRRLSYEARERVIRLVADHMGVSITAQTPRLSGVLPTGVERFQGLAPPIVAAPTFAIRKRPAVIWTLEDYVRDGALGASDADQLRAAAADRLNILICGGTGSVKTTLANALLAEPAFAADRVVMIEDTPELQCSAWDQAALLTRPEPHPVGIAELVRDVLRLRPDRIIIGEMRDGAAALETLKAWNTGHPGGLSTVHANSAQQALHRLEDLLAEVTAAPQHRLIAHTVDLIVPIRRTIMGREIGPLLSPRPTTP
nr:P-type conjugative transfer ATPase TrbB [Brevundimonas naejangsanensis]